MTDLVRSPIREFGLAGLVTDRQPWDLPPNTFTRARNVRIENSSITALPDVLSVLGPFTDDATGLTPIAPVFSRPFWITDEKSVIVMVMSNGEVRVYNDLSGGYILQAPAGGVDVNAPLYSTQGGRVFALTSTTNAPRILYAESAEVPGNLIFMPGWPSEYRCGLLEVYKNIWVAADIRISGIEFPNLVKWSDVYAQGDGTWLWDFTDPTTLAGENPIESSGQGIRALQPLRDSLMVYFDRSAWRMDLTLGSFVMSFTKVFSDDGAIGPYAVVTTHGEALVVGFKDIYMHNGVNKKSLTDRRLTRSFYNALREDYPVRAAYYPLRNEIWVTYRTGNEGEADSALIYNTAHDAWTPVSLRRPGLGRGDFVSIFEGPKLRQQVITYDDLTADGITYEGLGSTTYSDLFSTPEGSTFYGLYHYIDDDGEQGGLYDMESDIGEDRFSSDILIEHDRIHLDQALGTQGDKIKLLSRVFPLASGETIRVRVGLAETPSGSVTWGPWRDFTPGEDYAIDFRQAGRYLAYQIASPPGTSPRFSMTGMDIEWAVVAAR